MTLFNSRTISILLAASALSACTTADGPRPNYPITTPSTAPTPAPYTPQPIPPRYEPPAPAPSYTPPVSSTPLPPVTTPRYEPPPFAQPAPRNDLPPPPAMITRQVTKSTVTGKVVDAAGPPKVYTVKKGDNLDAIARTLKTTREALAKDNKLKEPYRLQPGDELKGPQSKGKAYVVGSGDTLFAISRRFNVTAEAIADANDISKNASIRNGQKLLLPEGFKDKGPIKTTTTVTEPAPYTPPPVSRPTPAPTQPAYTPPLSRPPAATPTPVTPRPTPAPAPYTPPPATRPTTPPVTRPTTPPATTPPASKPPLTLPSSGAAIPDSQISELGRGRFLWPVRGDVLSEFGPKGTGSRNDGLNIRAVPGETVRASAEGDIVYAGDQVPGFGNLVLIKHADGWVTAYGHLNRVDVKMTQHVMQGQQIGQAGSTGGVAEPQLHFEVRYAPTPADRARPIDPKLVLPR